MKLVLGLSTGAIIQFVFVLLVYKSLIIMGGHTENAILFSYKNELVYMTNVIITVWYTNAKIIDSYTLAINKRHLL